jgi:hypothetical protein
MGFLPNSPRTFSHCSACPVLSGIECINAYRINVFSDPICTIRDASVVAGATALDLWQAGCDSEDLFYIRRTNAPLYYKLTGYLTITSPASVVHSTSGNLIYMTYSHYDASDDWPSSIPTIQISPDDGAVTAITWIDGSHIVLTYTAGAASTVSFSDTVTGLISPDLLIT